MAETARGGAAGGATTGATGGGGADGAALGEADGLALAETEDEPLAGAGAGVDAANLAYSAMNDFNAPNEAT